MHAPARTPCEKLTVSRRTLPRQIRTLYTPNETSAIVARRPTTARCKHVAAATTTLADRRVTSPSSVTHHADQRLQNYTATSPSTRRQKSHTAALLPPYIRTSVCTVYAKKQRALFYPTINYAHNTVYYCIIFIAFIT